MVILLVRITLLLSSLSVPIIKNVKWCFKVIVLWSFIVLVIKIWWLLLLLLLLKCIMVVPCTRTCSHMLLFLLLKSMIGVREPKSRMFIRLGMLMMVILVGWVWWLLLPWFNKYIIYISKKVINNISRLRLFLKLFLWLRLWLLFGNFLIGFWLFLYFSMLVWIWMFLHFFLISLFLINPFLLLDNLFF